MFLLYFPLRHRQRPDRPNQPLEGPKTTPKRRPGEARDAPGGPQDGSKSATSAPRAAQTRLPSGLGGQVGPNWHKRAARRPSKGHVGPPAGRFCTLRGVDFRTVFFSRKASPKLSSEQSLRKPTPSTALLPCVTSTCGLVRRRTANQGVLIHV